MPRTKTENKQPSQRAPRRASGLGPGLHLVHVDLGSGQATTVRTLNGRRLTAAIADDVDTDLVDECRRKGRLMLACDTSRGPTLMGALQTRRTIEHEPDGSLVIAAKRVRIAADEGVSLEAGQSASMTLSANGKARMTGDRMVIDMSANVRVLSALVQLP
jgi:hypothetical protein